MTEQERVIKGLKCCVRDLGDCELCPYDGGMGKADCGKQLYADALALLKALLKAQQPVKPIEYDPAIYQFKYICGSCRHRIFRENRFCPNCGTEVKWE